MRLVLMVTFWSRGSYNVIMAACLVFVYYCNLIPFVGLAKLMPSVALNCTQLNSIEVLPFDLSASAKAKEKQIGFRFC